MRIGILLLLTAVVGLTPADAQPVRRATDRGPHTMIAVGYPRHMNGRKTASGERYDPSSLTVAHRTLPFGSRLELVSKATGRSVMVTVNDRGTVLGNVELITSTAAMRRLGLRTDGPAELSVSVWPGRESTQGVNLDRESTQGVNLGRESRQGVNLGGESESRPAAATNRRLPRFSIQLGAYSDRSAAEAVASSMQDAWIQTAAVKGQSVHRVFFGRYEDREEAEGWRARLDRLGIQGYVRTLRP